MAWVKQFDRDQQTRGYIFYPSGLAWFLWLDALLNANTLQYGLSTFMGHHLVEEFQQLDFYISVIFYSFMIL